MAGRRLAEFMLMVGDAEARIRRMCPGRVELVSGGAAWADHIAVALYEMGAFPLSTLTLHLPARMFAGRFEGSRDAQTANHYHRLFGAMIGFPVPELKPLPTVLQIESAARHGATLTVNRFGFKARNTEIAESVDTLIAYTWSNTDSPADGGTADTWRKCRAPIKVHVPLHSVFGSTP